jgi:hypothetical protein
MTYGTAKALVAATDFRKRRRDNVCGIAVSSSKNVLRMLRPVLRARGINNKHVTPGFGNQ